MSETPSIYVAAAYWTDEPPPGGEDLPIGSITYWSDLNGATPSGWALCDGTANAPGPDLRNSFIVGWGTRTVDTTGGGATHTHTDNLTHAGGTHADPSLTHSVTQPAAHVFTQPGGHSNHAVTQPADHTDVRSHVHNQTRLPTATGGSTSFTVDTSMSGTPATTSVDTGPPTANGVAAQVHSGTAVDAHSAHSGGAVDAHSGTAVTAHTA